MKIAWFTPLEETSAIGLASVLITNEISKLAEVHLWYPATKNIHPTNTAKIAISPGLRILPSMLAPYDVVVYQMGNHLPFHLPIFEASCLIPGVVILHDLVMQHFFAAYYFEYLRRPGRYLELMGLHYGPQGRSIAEETAAGFRRPVWETEEVMDYPLFEPALCGAWAVVTHSEFLRHRVEERFPGPVRVLPLPYRSPEAAAIPVDRGALGLPPDAAVMVSIGHVNRNKRIDAVLEALAQQRDHNLFYLIVGPCDPSYRSELDAIVGKHGLASQVRFTGRLSDRELASCLAAADLCVNLRHPSTEGASASVIEAMLAGKPIVVTDAAFYKELPDDCVRKIDLRHEQEQLEAALADFFHNQPAWRRMGARARRYAERNFRADTYARGILDLCTELLGAKPLLQYADRVGNTLRDMGVEDGMPILERVVHTSADLFGHPNATD